MARAQTELEILGLLDHPFLPTLYTHFETDKFYCLVMEYCSGGNLHSVPRASTQARKAVRKVAARKTLKRKAPVQETLQELESLEEKVRMTKQLIQEKETFIARSRKRAGLKVPDPTGPAEIRARAAAR
ncbi:hypothetical protein QYE76_029876 [Lolium multiflorum]|uniref:non-specific serine/threonine protein kinase n=1 Tax=Lolium multiflorum TaxID=4521 RepID=A0AAD8QNP8_LOLMU|nr:hypothetical protein QYE76_029876 [Lolium multiflorum]